MLQSRLPFSFVSLLPILTAAAAGAVPEGEEAVSYNFDVRPILAAKCFSCHGTDAGARKGKLRLDDLTGIREGLIVAGKPEESGLVKRIHSTDPEEVMPPPAKSPPLGREEQEILARWIAQGAATEKHWAFIPPAKPQVPVAAGALGPIDALVQAALDRRKLRHAAPAGKNDWLRRVTFALTGLPPSPGERAAFLAAPDNESSREAVVDRLLASPHFGERLGQDWLDAARYGDTFGRHEDADSETWPWRDWVIRSFNSNLPYDQFVLWQTAGDLLPQATQDQRLATCFNRLCVQSNESGSDPEEFRWAQVFDRVKTNATVFMGLTMECAQCHDHKYDPLSQKEYYQFASFFNNIDELGLFSRFSNGTPAPAMFVYKEGEAERHRALQSAVKEAGESLKAARAGSPGRFREWLKSNNPPGEGSGFMASVLSDTSRQRRSAAATAPSHYFSFDRIDAKRKKFVADSGGGPGSSENASLTPPDGKFGFGAGLPSDKDKKYEFPGIANFSRSDPFTFSFWLKQEAPAARAVVLHHSRAGVDAANRGYELTLENGRLTATLAYFYPGNAIRVQALEAVDFREWHHIGWTYDGSSRAEGLRLYIDGRPLPVRVVRDNLTRDIQYLKEWGDLDSLTVADATAGELITLQIGGRNLDKALRGAVIDELKVHDCALTEPELAMLADAAPGTAAGAGKNEAWLAWYEREEDPECREAAARLHEARVAENEFTTHLRDLMVMAEQPGARRATPVLLRGNHNSPGELVTPGTPASLSPWPAGAPGDRQGLARWLTAPEHPLTARVEVNRLWRLFFGRGLVATGHDFGIQGSPPSHPALLDWLAVTFREKGWNVKQLCREIALSRTFRQSSIPADADTLAGDPDNRWLSRGPGLRLPAEEIRDAALAVSGLLVPVIGGPSVKPWQPDGLWEDSGTQHVYEMGSGDDLHRRSLYTFWRRTCPPPMLSAFDAPSREFCLVQREESLTPLQTLATLNDRAFLDAARALAEKILASAPADDNAAVNLAFLQATGSEPTPAQSRAFARLFGDSLNFYRDHPAEAAQFLHSGNPSPAPAPAAAGAGETKAPAEASTARAADDAGAGDPRAAALMVVCRAIFSSEEFLRTW